MKMNLKLMVMFSVFTLTLRMIFLTLFPSVALVVAGIGSGLFSEVFFEPLTFYWWVMQGFITILIVFYIEKRRLIK